MKRFAITIIVFIYIMCLTACSTIKEFDETWVNTEELAKVNFPVDIEGKIFNQAPETIVSLSPAVTQMLIDLEIEDKIIGISSYCTTENNTEIQTVGSPANPDVDKIIELKPDIIITQSPIALSERSLIEKNGIKILYKPCPQSVVEFVDYYAMLSILFHGNSFSLDKTKAALDDFDKALSGISDLKSENTFVYIQTDFLAVATGDTLAGDVLSAFGSNIALDKLDMNMTPSEILNENPDIIFLSNEINKENLPDDIKSTNGYKNDCIIYIDNSYFEKPTSDLADLINEIASELDGYKQD